MKKQTAVKTHHPYVAIHPYQREGDLAFGVASFDSDRDLLFYELEDGDRWELSNLKSQWRGCLYFFSSDELAKIIKSHLERQSLFGCHINWTSFPWVQNQVYVFGYTSREEAKRVALNTAKKLGWTPRQWWQFWRANDSENGF